MFNHLEYSVIEHIYEVMNLPIQEESEEKFYKGSHSGFSPAIWLNLFEIDPGISHSCYEISRESFNVKLTEFKPDPIGEMLLSLTRETDQAADEALTLVNGHLERLNQEGANLLNQIPAFLNDIDKFCDEHGLSDISSIKKAHRLNSDTFDVYYNIVRGIFQNMKEKFSKLDISVRIKDLLDEAFHYIFKEECTLLPFLVEKLTDYKQKLQRSLGKLKETINDSGACKRALNKTYLDYYESSVEGIKRELRVSMEEFKFATDMLQRVHTQIYHAFSATPSGKEYFRTIDEEGLPGDELAVSLVRSCFASNDDETGIKYDIQPFFNYIIKERLLEYYNSHHTFQGFEYQPLFALSESQHTAVKQQITAAFKEAMIHLCGDDSLAIWKVNEVVSRLLAGTQITTRQSSKLWDSVFHPGSRHICVSVQGIQVNIRPLLVLAGYLSSEAVQILTCRQSGIRDELSHYEIFQCKKADQKKYYEAITQGHKGTSIPVEIEQIVTTFSKVKCIA